MPDVLPTSTPTAPKRSRVIDYGRDMGAARRWVRNTFTQEKVTGALKTLGWVVPLTLLIWIYAEREQLYPDTGVPIPINVTTGDPTRVVTLLRPVDKMILADLEGPRSQIDAVRNEFSRGNGIQALEIMIDRLQLPVGTHELRTATLLNNQSMFADRGITVTNTQPPTLHLAIDEYETREIAVEPPPTVTNLVGTPVFEPAKVRVRAPQGEFDRAGAVRVFADLASFSDLAVPGAHELPAVRVYSADLESTLMSIQPGTVKAKVEVRQADERYVMPVMVVYTVLPAALQKNYDVEVVDTVDNVTIIGPPDKIDQIRNDPSAPRPYAKLILSREDLPAGTTRTKRLMYELPPGIKVSAEDYERSVDYKLVEKAPEQ